MTTARRRQAERRGRWAELYAAIWLMAKGYRLLGRRLRTPFGEVDLAAFKSGAVIIVEVKQRRDLMAGLQAVGPHQQGRLARAAQALCARWRLTQAPIRFDVMVVGEGLCPKHVRGAWEASG